MGAGDGPGLQLLNPHVGNLSVFKQWNDEDPPSALEEKRNQVIYDTYRHDPQPDPEQVEAIW